MALGRGLKDSMPTALGAPVWSALVSLLGFGCLQGALGNQMLPRVCSQMSCMVAERVAAAAGLAAPLIGTVMTAWAARYGDHPSTLWAPSQGVYCDCWILVHL